MAAQVVTIVMSNPYADQSGPNKIEISWTSATGGAVSAEIASTYAAALSEKAPKPTKIQGFIVRVVTNPGTTKPTDNYDITLLDEDSVDVASGNLNNRDDTNSEDWIPSDPPYVDGTLTFTIATAGDAKVGKCTIYLVP